jgi:hypothetical protein
MRKKRQDMRIACRLVAVASLRFTPGVYVGVKVRSEEAFSAPTTPSGRSSSWDFFSLRRAARLRKVGRAIVGVGTA